MHSSNNPYLTWILYGRTSTPSFNEKVSLKICYFLLTSMSPFSLNYTGIFCQNQKQKITKARTWPCCMLPITISNCILFSTYGKLTQYYIAEYATQTYLYIYILTKILANCKATAQRLCVTNPMHYLKL